MMKKFRYILSIALIAAASAVSAQNGIEIKTPERIARMLESMPVSNIPTAGQFQCTDLSSTLMFYTEAERGFTVQLGARLFSDGVRKAYDPVIISFIERLWVELLLRKTTASQISLLKEYGVRIVLGGYPLGSGSFNQLDKALNVINSISSFSITTGGTEIDVFMRDKAGSTLHIYIPSSRDLLFPYDKKEHEERLIKDLTETNASYKQVIPDLVSPTVTKEGLLVTGGDCYMIDSLRNDVFFSKDKRILYDTAYPDETMRNILMCAAPGNKIQNMDLNIRLHTYDKQIGVMHKTLAGLLGYFQQQGVQFYTGYLGEDGKRHQCLLAMFHPVYNYIHILSVSFLPEQLDSKDVTVINADLSTFIPQHNIKNLFQEK